MSPQPVSPVEVRRQIWESLVSMVRVYAHAASLGNDTYEVAATAEAVRMTTAESTLHIAYSPLSGNAQWNLRKPGHDAEGTFHIGEEGHLIFPEGEKELDAAAIDWVEQLGRVTAAGVPA